MNQRSGKRLKHILKIKDETKDHCWNSSHRDYRRNWVNIQIHIEIYAVRMGLNMEVKLHV